VSAPIDRAGFLAALDQQLDIAREDGSILGLAILDVRDFNRINGVYGFAAGDQVIAEIAERLSGISRKSPVARRVGANQFAVIFSGIASPELSPLIGSRIVRTASESLLVGSQEIVFDVQVGLSAFPNDAWSAENLYFLAEQALRVAKRSNTAYAVHAPATNYSCGTSRDWPSQMAPSRGRRRCCVGSARTVRSVHPTDSCPPSNRAAGARNCRAGYSTPRSGNRGVGQKSACP
jgi:diguanylate cyclase (GGDEF)-like protein